MDFSSVFLTILYQKIKTSEITELIKFTIHENVC